MQTERASIDHADRRAHARRHRSLRLAGAVVSVATLIAACSTPADDDASRDRRSDLPSGEPASGTVFGVQSSAPTLLRSQQSCDAVLDGFQTAAADQWSGYGFGGGFRDVATSELAADGAVEESAPAPANASAGDDASGATSTTNTQEAGIDEPDRVETDGDHVFVVDGAELVILDGATADVRSRTEISPDAQLLLSDDRLLVISSTFGPMAFADDAVPVPDSPAPAPDVPVIEQPVDPGFGGTPTTVIELYDVAEVASPQLVQRSEFEGHHVTTRVVDGVARLVVSTYPTPQPLLEAQGAAFEDDGSFDDGAMERAVDETTLDDWLPGYRVTDFGGRVGGETTRSGAGVACADVFLPDVDAGLTETSILRVDFDSGFDPAATTTIVAEAGNVYASSSTLYLAATAAVPVTGDGTDMVAPEDWTTAIHAFDLRGEGAATHLAAGSIPGSTLNQYSLSEHEGVLRVATTTGVPWGDQATSESGVHVLRAEGGALREIGAVTGLGVTETIQSVRFMGPVAYVVTFRQTDPLYVVDLSDPTAPVAVGELKIPGFSSYLHPAGPGRLIGIGRDADLDGRDLGFALSLFDVSDPTAPRQVQRFTATDTYSAAEQDPKAFLWWADEGTVVVPIETFASFGPAVDPAIGSSDDAVVPPGPDTGPSFAVFDVSDGGIDVRGSVTAAGKYPSRSLVVQGALWSLFDGGVVVSDFDAVGDGVFVPFR